MSKIVLFGLGKVADVVHYYLANESEHDVVAFTCDPEFIESSEHLGLPVVSFAEVQEGYPSDEFEMFIALGYQEMNDIRADRLAWAREKGYKTPSFIHERSGIPSQTVVGDNCFIMNNVCIQPRVRIGNNVFIWSGALIGHHSTIGDNCWITSNSNIAGSVVIGSNTFVAVNATIANDVKIGSRCFLGANTLVTKDLPDGKVVIEKSTDVQRLTSDQFIRISKFH